MSLPPNLLFLLHSPLFLLRIIRLRESISQIQQILRHSDGIQQCALTLIELFFREQLLNLLPRQRHVKNLFTAGSQLRGNLNEGLNHLR